MFEEVFEFSVAVCVVGFAEVDAAADVFLDYLPAVFFVSCFYYYAVLAEVFYV